MNLTQTSDNKFTLVTHGLIFKLYRLAKEVTHDHMARIHPKTYKALIYRKEKHHPIQISSMLQFHVEIISGLL